MIVINSDKTISINGIKTFINGLFGMCHDWADGGSTKPETCAESASKCSEFMWNMSPASNTTSYTSPTAPWLKAHVDNNVLFLIRTIHNGYFSYVKDNPNLFGYIQKDEADGVSTGETPADLLNLYNLSKNSDNTHPVILNHWHDTNIWYPLCDIFSWDNYFIQDTPVETAYTRGTCIFLWEARSYSNVVSQISSGNLDNATKPVFTILQANALPYSAGSHYYAAPTKEEKRCLAYTAITMGVKGIAWWTYSVPYTTPEFGLISDSIKLQETIEIVKELKGLNDLLVLPTLDRSYEYLTGSRVTFSPNITINIEGRNRKVLNYVLKQDGNKIYLIVVNKSNSNMSETITISGLGDSSATTLGNPATGARVGRVIPVTNGSFTDNFLPYETNIYYISACSLLTAIISF